MLSISVRLAAGQTDTVRGAVLSPFCFLLYPFLSLFLLVNVFVLSLFCFLLFPFCFLLFPFCFLLSPFCFLLSPFLLAIVSVLSPFCFLLSPFLSPFLLVIVLHVFLLISHVSKKGLGNASLLSHRFGAYGGVILTFDEFVLRSLLLITLLDKISTCSAAAIESHTDHQNTQQFPIKVPFPVPMAIKGSMKTSVFGIENPCCVHPPRCRINSARAMF